MGDGFTCSCCGLHAYDSRRLPDGSWSRRCAQCGVQWHSADDRAHGLLRAASSSCSSDGRHP